ncbi:helix-turn-helix transcriptional regulator [Actinocorallia aurea]
MPSGQGPVVESALLREELVRSRKDAGYTQEQVAAALEWHPSKLIRIEGGKTGINRVDLGALLVHYGVTSESKQARMQDLARGAREQGWWSGYREMISDRYLNFVGYESGASFLRHYHGTVFPGLLQLPEYAEVLEASADAEPGAAMRSPGVRLKLERQRHLAERADQPQVHYVIDEAVLRRQIGVSRNPGVQQRQIRYAVEQARANPRISIQIVPFSAGFYVGLRSLGFNLLEFDGPLDDVVYIEGAKGASQLATDPDVVNDYRDVYAESVDEALPPDKSLDLMLEVAAELDDRV